MTTGVQMPTIHWAKAKRKPSPKPKQPPPKAPAKPKVSLRNLVVVKPEPRPTVVIKPSPGRTVAIPTRPRAIPATPEPGQPGALTPLRVHFVREERLTESLFEPTRYCGCDKPLPIADGESNRYGVEMPSRCFRCGKQIDES